MFWEISQNLQENTCAGVPFLINLRAFYIIGFYFALFRNVLQPNHPKHYQYPKPKYKETDSSPLAFQLDWYRRYRWLRYSVEKDTAFCFYCCKCLETHDISERVESAYTVTGFYNWKRALESKKGFAKQQSSGLHKKAKDEVHPEIPNRDPPEMMSSNLKNERKSNQDIIAVYKYTIFKVSFVPYLKCLYGRSNQVFNIHYIYFWKLLII